MFKEENLKGRHTHTHTHQQKKLLTAVRFRWRIIVGKRETRTAIYVARAVTMATVHQVFIRAYGRYSLSFAPFSLDCRSDYIEGFIRSGGRGTRSRRVARPLLFRRRHRSSAATMTLSYPCSIYQPVGAHCSRPPPPPRRLITKLLHSACSLGRLINS